MQFRTEVEIPLSDKKITLGDSLFFIGSCFATEIANLMASGQMKTLCNPFGTIFNPYSINYALKRLHSGEPYTEADLINYGGAFISLDHYSGFNTPYAHKTLAKINEKLEEANFFLQKTQWVVITYGTSFIYEFLPQGKRVANCHKIPQKFFTKRLLTTQEIITSIKESIELIKDICKAEVQILFSLSPVRHTKDGFPENQWSKARLLNALHEAIDDEINCHYLPIYELMMDELRDYRFYKEDMIHPTQQAVHYIFEKFGNAYFSDEVKAFIADNFKILQSLNHRPNDEKSPQYIEFRERLRQKIAEQQKKVKHRIFTRY